MKKTIIIIGLMFGFLATQAQKTTKPTKAGKEPEVDCYNKWVKKFKERGADDVADGTYKDVVIVIRETNSVNCYDGKAEVFDNAIQSFAIQLEDGTYEAVAKELKAESRNAMIENGMSKTIVSKDGGTLINVLFPKKIKPKKAPPKKAAEPVDD